ncbi:hypothetical protein J635_0280 [Acinetobacter baumannii 233846]|nr:hypothetical protein J635_0280 [Acinetobacter baumannii 233846]
MNRVHTTRAAIRSFLNGVCRHELTYIGLVVIAVFLNGVCRHERSIG